MGEFNAWDLNRDLPTRGKPHHAVGFGVELACPPAARGEAFTTGVTLRSVHHRSSRHGRASHEFESRRVSRSHHSRGAELFMGIPALCGLKPCGVGNVWGHVGQPCQELRVLPAFAGRLKTEIRIMKDGDRAEGKVCAQPVSAEG